MTIRAALSPHAGAWAGTNGFRLLPSDPLCNAAATAHVSMAAGGSLVTIAYTWSHPKDGAQDGLLVVGAADGPGAVAAFWGDSWHQSPTPQALGGIVNGDAITVGYDYETQWRWEITVDARDPESLRLRMDNVVPPDAAVEGTPAGPYPAMVMDLRRSSA